MLQLLASAPPEYKAIQRAFLQALRVTSKPPHPLRVGLVCNGVLVATGDLHGYRQAACLSEYMHEFGWREQQFGSVAEMHGCELVYLLGTERAEDPSFIRRPVMQLWA